MERNPAAEQCSQLRPALAVAGGGVDGQTSIDLVVEEIKSKAWIFCWTW